MNPKINETISMHSFNIIYIDQKIRNHLYYRILHRSQYKEELICMKWIKKKYTTNIDKIKISDIYNKHYIIFLNISSECEYGLYLYKISNIIEKYKSIINIHRPFIVIDNTYKNNISTIKKLMNKYLTIAQNYINITDWVISDYNKDKCNICGNIDLSIEYNHSTCNKCGFMVEYLDIYPTYKDGERVNMTSKYTYLNSSHFDNAIKCFQGKQNIKNYDKLELDILKYMGDNNINRDSLTKSDLRKFINKNKKKIKNIDINLIFHYITKKDLPDISIYEHDLFLLYNKYKEYYIEVKDPNRQNSLNIYFILCKLLQILGYKCNESDFCSLRTPKKIEEHNKKFEEVRKIAGWNI